MRAVTWLLALLLLCASPALAQVSVVQSAADTANPLATAGDKTVALSGAATAGNHIVVIAINDTLNRTVASLAGAGGDTTSYSLCKRQNTANGGLEIWAGTAAGTNPGTTITATMSATSGISDSFLIALEVSGTDTGVACNTTTNGASTTGVTSHASGSVTPATAHNLTVIASYGGNRTWTFDTAPTFTQIHSAGESAALLVQAGYAIQTSASAIENNITSSSTSGAELAIVSLAGTAGGGATCTGAGLLLGAGKCDE